MQQLLDAMVGVPALVQNGRLDIVATNRLGRALFSEATEQPAANFARYVFLDPRARAFYRDWDDAATQTTAILRTEVGRIRAGREFTDLVDELVTGSDDFRALWVTHDVRDHRTGLKLVTHPVVGDLDLSYEVMDLSTDRGLTLVAYTAAPGSSSATALRLLGAWADDHAPATQGASYSSR